MFWKNFFVWYLWLYLLGIETVSCRLLLRLNMDGPPLSSLNAMLAKITKLVLKLLLNFNFYDNWANLARWLVENYGLWEYRPWIWRNMSPKKLNRPEFSKPLPRHKMLLLSFEEYLTNRPQFSMVYTRINHRNDAIKCSKLCSETTRRPAFRGSTWVLNILWRHFYGL